MQSKLVNFHGYATTPGRFVCVRRACIWPTLYTTKSERIHKSKGIPIGDFASAIVNPDRRKDKFSSLVGAKGIATAKHIYIEIFARGLELRLFRLGG